MHQPGQVFGFHLGSDNHQLPLDRHFLGDFYYDSGEFNSVWTLCWMEGFALPPAVWLYGILIWNSEVDLFYIWVTHIVLQWIGFNGLEDFGFGCDG